MYKIIHIVKKEDILMKEKIKINIISLSELSRPTYIKVVKLSGLVNIIRK